MNGTTHGPGIDVAAPSRNGVGGTGEWPRRSFLELGALPGAVPCARLHARQVMWEWGLDASRDDTELVVSELVTNAVRAAASLRPAASVRMWLRGNTTRVLVLVWDACPHPPVQLNAGQNADGGRGLLLVEALSNQWDWYALDQPEGGKIVWATLGPATPGPAAH